MSVTIDDIYASSSKFLRAADLQKTKVIVEISGFSVETMKGDDGDKKQIALQFKGKEKVLGLNKTNAQRIAAHSGSNKPEDWIGAKIKLIPTTTEFQGREVDCIRVSDEFYEPAPGKSAAIQEGGDDIVPF